MRPIFLFIALLTFLSSVAGQAAKPLVPRTDSAFFAKYDFSEALKPKTKFLGFIEPNYQRLRIEFQSVKKSKRNSIYLVNGVTQVKNNKCSFTGHISFEKLKRKPTDQMHLGVDDELKNSGIQEQGQLLGRYEFNEDSKPNLCGVFKGTMHLNYYIDRLGRFRYDDIEASYSDSFENNQYKGTWTPNGSSKAKVANWGEFRIPDSGDLDIGAGEFGPSPKYLKQGWDDLVH